MGARKTRRFSTYLLRVIALLVVGSVLLGSGVLYIYFGRKLETEFKKKMLVQKGQIELLLDEKIVKLQNSARDLSRDNTIRVTLLLNVRSKLEDRLANLYPSSGGTYFFIHKKDEALLYPTGYASLPGKILEQVLPRLPQGKAFADGGDLHLMWCFSAPILKGTERMGTAFVVYDLTADFNLISKVYHVIDGDIVLIQNGRMSNLTSLKQYDISPATLEHISGEHGSRLFLKIDKTTELARINGPENLFFVFSTESLVQEKQRITLLILLFSLSILVFSAMLSFFLGRQLSKPLLRMSEKAMLISQGEKDVRFDENTGFREFDHLSEAFNYMLQNLKEAEQRSRYQELLHSVDDAVYLVDPRGNIIDANDATYEPLGYDRQAFSRLGLARLLPEEDAAELLIMCADTSGRIKRRMETFHITSDGSRIPVEIIARTIDYNQETAILCVARDITKRLEAVEALRESEERYRSVVENAHDGILLVDEQLHIIFANNECRRILQYAAEELVGRDFKSFLASPKLAREMEQSLKQGAELQARDEFDIRRKDGQIRRCKISVGLIGNPHGQQRSVLHLLDITERRKAQLEKRQLEQLLIQSQKMEAIGTLAGGIAHDFNNLLMAIQGRIALIELQLDPEDPNVEHIQAILRAVKSASGLTKQLLGYARGGKYQVKITDMNELVEKSAHMFSRTKKEITIVSHYAPDLWPVAVDRGQIEQVMLNLYVNAWQAMPDGGTMTMATANVMLDERQCQPFQVSPGRYVMVTVRDTGVGMDESVKSRIFEPFFTTKKIGTGTGLGLASAYGIIRNHNGIIRVESQKGAGSTFSIYLPAVEKAVELEEGGEDGDGEVITGNETLLLVDAEEGVRQVGKLMIQELGYDLLTASNGEEAVSLFRTHARRVSAVILDMTMPEMSGSETFEKMRQIDPGVRVILSSGYDLNNKIDELHERGYAGFIQKPFDLALLSKKIREVLDEE